MDPLIQHQISGKVKATTCTREREPSGERRKNRASYAPAHAGRRAAPYVQGSLGICFEDLTHSATETYQQSRDTWSHRSAELQASKEVSRSGGAFPQSPLLRTKQPRCFNHKMNTRFIRVIHRQRGNFVEKSNSPATVPSASVTMASENRRRCLTVLGEVGSRGETTFDGTGRLSVSGYRDRRRSDTGQLQSTKMFNFESPVLLLTPHGESQIVAHTPSAHRLQRRG